MLGVCGVRLSWLRWVFPQYKTFMNIMLVFPISLATTALLMLAAVLYFRPSRRTFPIEEFDGKEFLMPYGRFDIDVNAALSPKKVKPNIRPCHVDDETVIRMVSKGLGITMMTEIMMRGRTHGVKTLPVSPKTGRELGIGMHLSKNTPEEILRLRECVLDFTRELM